MRVARYTRNMNEHINPTIGTVSVISGKPKEGKTTQVIRATVDVVQSTDWKVRF